MAERESKNPNEEHCGPGFGRSCRTGRWWRVTQTEWGDHKFEMAIIHTETEFQGVSGDNWMRWNPEWVSIFGNIDATCSLSKSSRMFGRMMRFVMVDLLRTRLSVTIQISPKFSWSKDGCAAGGNAPSDGHGR
jgi:hypothetical protein